MSEPNEITDLLKIVARLAGLLEREVEMLRAMKPFEIQALQQDKLVLTAAYEARIKSLRENPEFLGDLPADLRTALRETIQRFRATLADNELCLRAAREATERALTAIADEVRLRVHEHTGYSDKGVAAPPKEAARATAVSVAFDQQF